MNETLKNELKIYFKVVNERKKHIEDVLEDAKVDLKDIKDEIENKAELKLHSLVKGFIKEIHFTGRNGFGDRIFLGEYNIEYIEFNKRNKHTVSLLGKWKSKGFVNEWFPIGFKDVIAGADRILNSINEIDIKYYDKKNIKIKMELVNNDKLEEGRVEKIIIEDDIKFETKDMYLYGDEKYQLLTDNKIYGFIEEMIQIKMKWKQRVMVRVNAIEREMNKLLDEDYIKILVAARMIQ